MKTVAKCLTVFVLILLACIFYFFQTLEVSILEVNPNREDHKRDEVMITKNVEDLYSPKKLVNSCSKSSRRFVIGLSYWEQLNMAMRNMLQLVVVANDWGSRLVEPYTLNSRLFGLRNFVIKKGPSMSHNRVALPLRELFDVDQLNNIICTRGLPHLTPMQEFINISVELVIVVHFVYSLDTPNDLNVPADIKPHITTQFNSRSVVDCGQLLEQYSNRFTHLLRQESNGTKRNFVIKKYYCVDGSKLISTKRLAEMLAISDLEEFTVIVVDWHGYSKKLMIYNSAKGPHANNRASLIASYNGPSFAAITLPHSQRVINAAERYSHHSNLITPYIAVHIRSEKIGHAHRIHHGGYLASCMKEMMGLTEQLKRQYNIANVIICTDVGEAGSDSCVNCHGGSQTLKILRAHDLKVTHFDPTTVGEIHDSGLIGLVEMNILGRGHHLIAVGGGSFQNQTEQNFIHYHSISNYDTRIHEICVKRY